MKIFLKQNLLLFVFLLLLIIIRLVFYSTISSDYLNIIYIDNFLKLIIAISLYKKFEFKNTSLIRGNQKLIYPFLLVIASQLLIKLIMIFFKIEPNFLNIILFQFILLIILFLIVKYFFSYLSIEKYKFITNYKFTFLAIVLALLMKSITLIQSPYENFDIVRLILSFIRILIFPALYEEIIYRGMIIGWLKKYNLSNLTINIIQCIIFGLSHYGMYSSYGILGILGTSNQMMTGFILGQLYIYSGSLIPCALMHAIINL